MRRIPSVTQRILDQLRADSRGRYRGDLRPTVEQRRAARDSLPALKIRVRKPMKVGAALRARLDDRAP